MPAERIPMRQVFQALRLVLDQGRSQREVGRVLGLSQSTVNEYVRRFRASGLAWPISPDTDDGTVEARLFTDHAPPTGVRPMPDWSALHAELKRKGVTLQLLWIEYKQGAPDGYQYTQFCRHYHAWADTLTPVLRQLHVAGEKCFVDYAGLTMPIVDALTGDIREAEIFVGALGASHLIFVEATWTQSLADWIASHVHMVEYFGGVSALYIPDNLKAGVTTACFYEPVVHSTYQDFATHYGTAILPARVATQRDKGEGGDGRPDRRARDLGPVAARRVSHARGIAARYRVRARARE